MVNKKGRKETKRNLNNDKYETASEIGTTDIGFKGVKRIKLKENEVQKIVSRAKRRFIGFK